MHHVSKTAALASALFAAACGGGSSSTTNGAGAATGTGAAASSASAGAGGSGPTAEAACAAEAHALCTLRDTCSANGFENDEVYGSEADCEARTVLGCAASLMAKGTAQTAAHVQQCAAAYATEPCVDYYDSNPVAACVPPAGSLANGTACGASGQCSSTFCAAGAYAVCGTCEALPAAGAACQVQGDCGRDLACEKPAGATAQDVGKCAAWVPAGGACLTGVAPCEAGLGCLGDVVATSTMGKCRTAGATVGATCDTDRLTATACDFQLGLECIPTNGKKGAGTCQTVMLVAAGQPCGVLPGNGSYTSYAECEAGGACIKAAAADGTGTCMAPAATGAACDSDITVGPPCLGPAKCVPGADGGTAGVCTVPDAPSCI